MTDCLYAVKRHVCCVCWVMVLMYVWVHVCMHSKCSYRQAVLMSILFSLLLQTPKKLTKNPTPRKILGDQNPGVLPPSSETFLCGQLDTSIASTVSTYSEFQVCCTALHCVFPPGGLSTICACCSLLTERTSRRVGNV